MDERVKDGDNSKAQISWQRTRDSHNSNHWQIVFDLFDRNLLLELIVVMIAVEMWKASPAASWSWKLTLMLKVAVCG